MHGEIIPQGAKNEALQVICATLLTDQKVTISNVPEILDVLNLIKLLQNMGVEIVHVAEGKFTFQASSIRHDYIQTEEFRQLSPSLRGSIMMGGPLLARFGEAYIGKPGGDKIGRRRLDTHFVGLQRLGAEFGYIDHTHLYQLKAKKLTGAYMLLDEASVTGTANVIMAAVLAQGVTTIYNAACEPYIQQLCRMLIRMGAKIAGVGSNLLSIHGVSRLSGCNHCMLPDMIEVGSFIGMAAMTRSEITLKDVAFDELGMIPSQFERLGI